MLKTRIHASWIVDGEDRVGYAALTQLIECVRELHWRRDVLAVEDASNVDSVTRTITLDFPHPVLAGAEIIGRYGVRWVRHRSYGLDVSLSDASTGLVLASAAIVNVFYDADARRSVVCPALVRDVLANAATSARDT